MGRTLANSVDRAEIRQRIAALTAGSRRVWGTMSVGGMLCHVDDSYQVVMGERPLSPSKLAIPQGMAKLLALRSPFRWPRGMATGESVRQGGGGTPPAEFVEDRARLLQTFARFCEYTQLIKVHPMLGEMQRADWLRWGWLHADHHLRQFGA